MNTINIVLKRTGSQGVNRLHKTSEDNLSYLLVFCNRLIPWEPVLFRTIIIKAIYTHDGNHEPLYHSTLEPRSASITQVEYVSEYSDLSRLLRMSEVLKYHMIQHQGTLGFSISPHDVPLAHLPSDWPIAYTANGVLASWHNCCSKTNSA